LRPRSILRTDWLVLAGVCGFFFFFGLSWFGLVGADEPRYAQVAREMLARHDWITPTLGGKPWLEKPVLYYWQAMLAYSIFGVSDWAARLPSAVDATLMVLASYLFLRRFRSGSELDGAVMIASAAGVIGFARAASTDMPLAAMFSIAMLAWYAWYESEDRKALAVFYLFLALGMLAKGPVAPFLAAVVVIIFAIVKRDYRLIRRTLWGPGIVLFCAVGLPWYVAVQMKNPQFFREFILQHNLARFSSNMYHHKEPFWYYVPVALLMLVPWTTFVVAALVKAVSTSRKERHATHQSTDNWSVFLIIWWIVPVVFFSISQSKLPGYIAPAIPAGALLLAEYVRRQIAAGDLPGRLTAVLHAVVAAAAIVPALMVRYLLLQPRMPWNRATLLSSVIAMMLATAVALSLRGRAGLAALRFVTLVPAVLVVGIVLRLGALPLNDKLSTRPIADEIAGINTKHLPVAVFRVRRETEYGLTFYLNQVVPRYEFGQVPAGAHFVVAPAGSQAEVGQAVAGRRVSYLGEFAPQSVDYFWVSAQP
jgi:4-amino-4-deoxy-L-arabinose transferase-like glycosyltransferase